MKSRRTFLSAFFILHFITSTVTYALPTKRDEIDPWHLNPLSGFVTKKQWNQILQEDLESNRRYRVQTLFVNTTDQKSCEDIQRTIKGNSNWKPNRDIDELCTPNKDYPWASVTTAYPVSEAEMIQEIRIPVDLRPDSPGLARETFNFGIMGVGMMGILIAMPESVTKWDKSKSQDEVLTKWKKNISGRPVVDKDDWAVNYIGHPLSGAAYYVVARHMNYSMLDSFKYSFLMSTFFWEYGIEAIAEQPSIQDLIITPILGSLLGEVFYQGSKTIEANGNQILGSKKLGKISLFLLNPAGQISNGINHILDSKIVQSNTTYFYLRQHETTPISGVYTDNKVEMGLQFVFNFW